MGIGDVVAQFVENYTKKEDQDIDFVRTSKMTAFGGIVSAPG
jgi:hypothetical protein